MRTFLLVVDGCSRTRHSRRRDGAPARVEPSIVQTAIAVNSGPYAGLFDTLIASSRTIRRSSNAVPEGPVHGLRADRRRVRPVGIDSFNCAALAATSGERSPAYHVAKGRRNAADVTRPHKSGC